MQRTVRLLVSHDHAGRTLAPGTQFTTDERRAAWLVEQGRAEFVGAPAPQKAALLTNPRPMAAASKSGTAAATATAPARRSWGCCGGKR